MTNHTETQEGMRHKIDRSVGRITKAIEQLRPKYIYGLFSGGHDSLSACYVASLAPGFSGVIHINTGIGVPKTREFVHQTAFERGWPLLEYKATENTKADGTPDPMNYEDIIMDQGFPGPYAHRFMYIKLKERQLNRVERDLGVSTKKPILYISGARSQESERRMGTTQELQKEGRRIWCAAIHDWTKLDTTDLIAFAGLRRNPVVDLIHKSGECLCGAFAKEGELEELKMWDETRPCYERIKALEKRVRESGKPWGWEDKGPPQWWIEKKKGQCFLMEYNNESPMHLCWSCSK